MGVFQSLSPFDLRHELEWDMALGPAEPPASLAREGCPGRGLLLLGGGNLREAREGALGLGDEVADFAQHAFEERTVHAQGAVERTGSEEGA